MAAFLVYNHIHMASPTLFQIKSFIIQMLAKSTELHDLGAGDLSLGNSYY